MSLDLEAVKARYERMVALTEEDPQSAVHACAISYSIDVPALITEVDLLRAQAEIYEAEIRAMLALADRMRVT